MIGQVPTETEIAGMSADEAAAHGIAQLQSALLTPNWQLRAEWAGLAQAWFALAQFKAIREGSGAAPKPRYTA